MERLQLTEDIPG